jgi:hypothetical protein
MPRLPFVRNPFAILAGLLVAAFVILQVFTFCSGTKNCPAFSNAPFDAWFPYKEGQQVVFMNSRRDTDSLWISSVVRSGPTVINTGIYGRECSINAEIKGEGAIRLLISCRLKGDVNPTWLLMEDFDFSARLVGDAGPVADPAAGGEYKSVFYNSIHLEGKAYPSVSILERDTAGIKAEGLYRVYLSKENGIIAYEKYPSHDLWVKQ